MDNKYNEIYMKRALEIIESNWSVLEPYCEAIYLGGSRVDSAINTPHDYDFIIFAKNLPRATIEKALTKFASIPYAYIDENDIPGVSEKDPLIFDFSQVKIYPYTRITRASYLDLLLVKVIGNEVCVRTDVIVEHREEFKKKIREQMQMLLDGREQNPKRWYQVLRAGLILKNNSYEVTEAERKDINTLHDLAKGWEKIKDKTIKLINKL